MPNSAFRIHGVGHGLADLILPEVDFTSSLFQPYHSKFIGDGGLEMGKLVFLPDFLDFAKSSWDIILEQWTKGQGLTFNAGGPALVSMTLAAQLLNPSKIPVTFYGCSGDDGLGSRLRHLLAHTPLDLTCFRQRQGASACTWLGTDLRMEGGMVERFFIHSPGDVSFDLNILGESFFQATFNVYAATALLPELHSALPMLLAKGRRRGALNIVATIYDFQAEKSSPGKAWTLGIPESYSSIDLLVANSEEIRKLAGLSGIEESAEALFQQGLTACIVTLGAQGVYHRSLGGIFGQTQGYVPAHPKIMEAVKNRPSNMGDTVGAGDNFLGGLLADLQMQILEDDFYPKGEIHIERELLEISPLRLRHAIDFGIVCGGLACLQVGGLHLEKAPGDSLSQVRSYLPEPLPSGQRW